MLIVVTLLGLAAALVIPAMGSVGVLRVQAAVRSVVSDITYAQADAVAFQERRAVMFDVEASSYRLVQVPGDTLDPDTGTMYDSTKPGGLYIVDFRNDQFGGARITAADFDGETTLIFDALGGPVVDPGGNVPGEGGFVTITGSGQTFDINVQAFTGLITVDKVDEVGG